LQLREIEDVTWVESTLQQPNFDSDSGAHRVGALPSTGTSDVDVAHGKSPSMGCLPFGSCLT
jgi:hypothetical protein